MQTNDDATWTVSFLMSVAPQKKTDVAEHPEVFDHVGILVNEPPRQDRVALCLVIRRFLGKRRSITPEPLHRYNRTPLSGKCNRTFSFLPHLVSLLLPAG